MHKQHTWLIQSQSGQVLGTTPHDRDKTPGSLDMRLKWPVALLRHDETAHSVTAVRRQQLVLQLQRRLGNTYVRRILEAQRDSRNPGPILIINRQTDSIPPAEEIATDPVPPVSGTGEPHEVLAFAPLPNVRLRGRTRARFNGGNFRTENVVTEAGSGCRRC